MPLERKTVVLGEAKVAGDASGPGLIEGYASLFNTAPDSYGDVIDAGAYKDTLPQFLSDGFVAWSHDWTSPVATPTAAREDQKGLFLSAEFHTHAAAQEARSITAERLARGKSMGLSIGYEALSWEERQVDTPYRGLFGELTDKVRALTKIRLFEVSLVMVPAQDSARVTNAKSLSFDDHSEGVRVAVAEWLERSKAGSALRLKVGRAISEARRQRMAGVRDSLAAAIDEIDGLLKETEPQKETTPDGWALYAAFQQTLASRYGAGAGVTRT